MKMPATPPPSENEAATLVDAPTDQPTAPPGYEIVDAEAWKEASQALQQLAEAREKMVRMQADFDNFRKRLAREKDDSIRYANESLLESLLPVVDNFELGLAAAETAPDARTIAQGMQMVRTQLQRFLGECGVEEINAVGAAFDPHLHEAIAQEPSPDKPEGTILAQRRKGYKLRDRLLRPAAVVVAHTPSDS
jgi:molecular chaperone GrpE